LSNLRLLDQINVAFGFHLISNSAQVTAGK